jgi:hypothetical protein
VRWIGRCALRKLEREADIEGERLEVEDLVFPCDEGIEIVVAHEVGVATLQA